MKCISNEIQICSALDTFSFFSSLFWHTTLSLLDPFAFIRHKLILILLFLHFFFRFLFFPFFRLFVYVRNFRSFSQFPCIFGHCSLLLIRMYSSSSPVSGMMVCISVRINFLLNFGKQYRIFFL